MDEDDSKTVVGAQKCSPKPPEGFKESCKGLLKCFDVLHVSRVHSIRRKAHIFRGLLSVIYYGLF